MTTPTPPRPDVFSQYEADEKDIAKMVETLDLLIEEREADVRRPANEN